MEGILEAWAREMLARYERALMIKRDELSQLADMPGAAVRRFVREIEKRWRTDEPADQVWNGSMNTRNTAAPRPRVVPGVPIDPRSGVAAGGNVQETPLPVNAVVASTTRHEAEIPASATVSAPGTAPGTAETKGAQPTAPSKSLEHPVPKTEDDPPDLTEDEVSHMYGQSAWVQGLERTHNALLAGGMGEAGQTYKLLTVLPERRKPPAPADSSSAAGGGAGAATQKTAADTPASQPAAAVVKADAQPTKQQPISAVHKKDRGHAGAATHNADAAAMAHTQSAKAEQEKKEAEEKKKAEEEKKKKEEKEEKEKLEEMYHQSAAAEHTEAVTAALLAGGMGQIQEPYPPLNAEHLRRSNKPDGQPAASPAQGTPSAPLAGTSAAHDTVGEIPATREAGPVTVVRAAAIGAPAALARVERSEGDAQHAKESSPQRGESSALTSSAATAHDASNTATKALEAFHGLDLDELAEQVLHRFARTMELEAERRGVSAWE